MAARCVFSAPDADLYSQLNNYRHGDFFTAILKARPEFLNDFQAKLWSRFFCLSVYITMYLNDNQRSAFYESLGLDTRLFNQHVIIETNNTTARYVVRFACVSVTCIIVVLVQVWFDRAMFSQNLCHSTSFCIGICVSRT